VPLAAHRTVPPASRNPKGTMRTAAGCWPKVSLCKLEDLGIDWWSLFFPRGFDRFVLYSGCCLRALEKGCLAMSLLAWDTAKKSRQEGSKQGRRLSFL
jgi:hypothetical protein